MRELWDTFEGHRRHFGEHLRYFSGSMGHANLYTDINSKDDALLIYIVTIRFRDINCYIEFQQSQNWEKIGKIYELLIYLVTLQA